MKVGVAFAILLLIALVALSAEHKKEQKDQPALELRCPEVSIIIVPASSPSLTDARKIADIFGPKADVCTVEAIHVRHLAN